MTDWNHFVRVAGTSLGQGVLATRTLFAGQIVGEITGRIIAVNAPEYDEEYCIELDERNVLEPGPPFRFLNHNCEPNCEVFGYDDDVASSSLWITALEDIPAGSELTIDYGWPAEGAIECHCGSPSCRGWVVAESEVDRLFDLISADDRAWFGVEDYASPERQSDLTAG